MKIRPVGAESFHAGGWTDTTKLSLLAILRTRLNWVNIRCREPSVKFQHLLVSFLWQQSGILRERSAAFRSQLAGKFGTQY